MNGLVHSDVAKDIRDETLVHAFTCTRVTCGRFSRPNFTRLRYRSLPSPGHNRETITTESRVAIIVALRVREAGGRGRGVLYLFFASSVCTILNPSMISMSAERAARST